MNCPHCYSDLTYQDVHDCIVTERSYNLKKGKSNKEFVDSAIIGAVTDSALLGGLLGGSFVGGILGDLANGGSLDDDD